MISLRESKDFCNHIANIMVYNFSCNGWDEKRNLTNNRGKKTEFFLPSYLDMDIVNKIVIDLRNNIAVVQVYGSTPFSFMYSVRSSSRYSLLKVCNTS